MLHSIPRMKTTSKGEREELSWAAPRGRKSCSKRVESGGQEFLGFLLLLFFSLLFLCCTSKEVPEREKDSADQSRGCWYERVPLTFISLLPVPHFSITTQPTFLKSSNNDNNSTCFEILILISNLFCSLPYLVIDWNKVRRALVLAFLSPFG